MKKITLLLASALVSAVAFASEPGPGSTQSGVAVVRKSESKFSLYYQGTNKANVEIKILNAAGKEVFAETVRKTQGFVRPYNFEAMKEGEYTIIADDGVTKRTQKVFYSKLVEQKAANVLQLGSNKYLLSIKGQFVSGKVNVKIYDGLTLLHQQNSDISGDFGQLFTIKSAADAIKFEVTDSDGKKIN